MTIYDKYRKICRLVSDDAIGASLLEDFISKACDYVTAKVIDKNSEQAFTTVSSSLQALNNHIELKHPELTLFNEDVFYTNIDSNIIELINSIFINRAK
ncbi:hypothetical protein [Seleniivibrio woodruffii]|uniref:hypothetical protein n=1 Tax=Seleniivibrio woodruffii TaxID=1078050 RepID=UPI002409D807|nr:hypothetical protein [Seleniivibrio woodruffii]